MYFAQFYQRGLISNDLIEACGDRSVIILDGRESNASKGAIAAAECKKRGYVAWRIFKGESFTRCTPVSNIWPVVHGAEDKSAMSAYRGA